jgi:epoxyqueuosine reductase
MRCEQGRLREELRLTGSAAPDAILALARGAGFDRAGIVNPSLLMPWADRLRAREQGFARDLEWSWLLDPSWSGARSILICCLSCLRHEPDDLSGPGDPHALIAAFARAHYYRTAIDMLRSFAADLQSVTGIPSGSLRFFSNSRIPEKPLLAASGLGTYGANGLAIVKGLGSTFVIAGAVLPVPSPEVASNNEEPRDPCGSCRRCRDACPVGAIVAPGVVDPGRCLQGMAGVDRSIPPSVMETWGSRLYGCQECQSVCPHNSGLVEAAPKARGELGPSIPLRSLLTDTDEQRRVRFQGSALGMSWISRNALLRNALIAAGNRRDASISEEIAGHAASDVPMVADTARWALARL